jgi:Tfp pilus assembly protein PilF
MTPDEHIEQGFLKWRAGDFIGAIANCEAALKLDSDCMHAYRIRAMAYVGLRDYKSAMIDFGRFLLLRHTDSPTLP